MRPLLEDCCAEAACDSISWNVSAISEDHDDDQNGDNDQDGDGDHRQ